MTGRSVSGIGSKRASWSPDAGDGSVGNGKRYTFDGHYLGDVTISYRATIEDADGEFGGDLSGVFDPMPGGPVPRAQVEALVRTAIRESIGFRP